MNLYKTFKHKKDNRLLEIHFDEDTESGNPRQWDNNGIMLCCHGSYILGDKQFDSSQEIDEFIKEEKPVVVLPLYLYDHGGITISTSDFNDHWDSGQVGYIIATKQNLKDMGWKKTPSKKEITKMLQSEVRTYDQYLRGNVFGFIEYKIDKCDKDFEHKENINSCWGFLGDLDENGIFDGEYNKKEWEEITN